jgi:hypothetical protein
MKFETHRRHERSCALALLTVAVAERRRLAVKGKALGRKVFGEVSNQRQSAASNALKDVLGGPLGGGRWRHFFTVEVLTGGGLVRYFVLFGVRLETRRVKIAGVTCRPWAARMKQWSFFS